MVEGGEVALGVEGGGAAGAGGGDGLAVVVVDQVAAGENPVQVGVGGGVVDQDVAVVVEVDLPVDADDLIDSDSPPREWVEVTVLAVEDYVPARVRIRHHVADEGGEGER